MQRSQSALDEGLFDQFGEALAQLRVAGVVAEPEGGQVTALELFEFAPVEGELVAKVDQRLVGEGVHWPEPSL
ncbi:hypothetical protein E1264_10550 [Actinomadura sp. KC216]|nr:hypothetical protein E1264_10550 [Actinomadura sp. KC216]